MESEFQAWSMRWHTRRKKCVDCHLPNDNVTMHYIWKSIDGMKDGGFLLFPAWHPSDKIKSTVKSPAGELHSLA